MRRYCSPTIRFFLQGLGPIAGFLLVGCSLLASSDDAATPVVMPIEGAPITAAATGKMLVITNDSEKAIYYRAFPTDILPVIEWAPCIAPGTCPAEQRIDPGQEKRISLNTVIREQKESITVFWWTYLDRVRRPRQLPNGQLL